ncbi:MAG: hypothetical protein ACR2QO_17430 [Acidimicrobiales bacterium]
MSSLCLAFVVIFDRLMVADCYRNRPDHAWLVSSLAGSVFGLVATAGGWVIITITTDTTMGSLVTTAGSLWPSRGSLMVLSGALAIQVTRHYFRLFAPTDGAAPVNETAIAMWLASTPIFIYVAVAALQVSGLDRGVLTGLDEANVSWTFGLLVLATVAALLRFEAVSTDDENGTALTHFTQVALLLATTVAYTVILSAVLLPAGTDLEAAMALLPLYWVGFAAGGRILLVAHERSDFRRNWRRVKRFIIPIAVAEVFGMAMFFSEFLALGTADPTLVNLIISAHVLLVFLIVLRLVHIRESMEEAGVRRRWFLGVRLVQRRLPERVSPIKPQLIWLSASMIGLVSASLLAG